MSFGQGLRPLYFLSFDMGISNIGMASSSKPEWETVLFQASPRGLHAALVDRLNVSAVRRGKSIRTKKPIGYR